MRRDALCMQRLKQLLSKARKVGGAAEFHETEDLMEFLIWAILTTYAAESRAAAALSKLQAALVDYNELRVTPVAEIVEIIGADYPMCRPAAEEISRMLHAMFNRFHHLNLDCLKAGSRRTAEAVLNSLDGVGPHARAMTIFHFLKGRAVPLDVNMYALLHKNGCIPADMQVEQAQRWLAGRLKERDIAGFYGVLKRYAAAHAPRRSGTARAPLAGAAAAKPAVTEPVGSGGSAPADKTQAQRKQEAAKKPRRTLPAKARPGRKQAAGAARGACPPKKPPRRSGRKSG